MALSVLRSSQAVGVSVRTASTMPQLSTLVERVGPDPVISVAATGLTLEGCGTAGPRPHAEEQLDVEQECNGTSSAGRTPAGAGGQESQARRRRVRRGTPGQARWARAAAGGHRPP